MEAGRDGNRKGLDEGKMFQQGSAVGATVGQNFISWDMQGIDPRCIRTDMHKDISHIDAFANGANQDGFQH